MAFSVRQGPVNRRPSEFSWVFYAGTRERSCSSARRSPTSGRELYERIGVSFELPAVYLRLTAIENLRLFAALYDRPVRDLHEVLADVDLADAADQRVDQFSKGMKMRLNLARALLHDPDLLFLDEPTTGQDPARARATRGLIKALKARGKTIFLTTHNMAEAEEVCDRVGFLFEGRIAVTGHAARAQAHVRTAADRDHHERSERSGDAQLPDRWAWRQRDVPRAPAKREHRLHSHARGQSRRHLHQ